MNKLDMQSKDNFKENIERIKSIFPDVVFEQDGNFKVDYKLLKQELGENPIDNKTERYELSKYSF